MEIEGITVFICGVVTDCEHDYSGWEDFNDPDGGSGGTAVCTKCGTRAIDESLRMN